LTDHFSWRDFFSLKSLFFIVLGAFFGTVAIQGFMLPKHFLDGGVTGISILIHEIFHINILIPLIGLNIPFVLIGYFKIGKMFAARAFLAVLLLALFMSFLHIPAITEDNILIAVFGGFFMGLGIGFVIRGGGVIDGLEVVAEYTNERAALSAWEIILLINGVIFLLAAYNLGLDKAMYSMLTYFTAIHISNYVVDGFEGYTALTIVSAKSEDVKSLIVNDFNKAISVYKGERGYLPGSFEVKHNCDILVTVVTRLEIHNLKKAIYEVDESAFIYVHSLKEVGGGVVKSRGSHK